MTSHFGRILILIVFVPGNCFYPVTLDNRGALLAQLIECQTLDRKVRISPGAQCCVLEQDTSSSLLSTGAIQENVPTWLKNC